jgi:hypothetical protein
MYQAMVKPTLHYAAKEAEHKVKNSPERILD